MISNLNNKNIYQFFADTATYYVTSTVCKSYTILRPEIFKYLIKNYQFKPKYITIDYNKACFKAINKCFPNINIIPYYFHLMKNC